MTVRASTRDLIEELARRWSAIYGGSLANHLPMALTALDAMGASDARVAEFARLYSRSHLEPMPAPRESDEPRLGAPESYPAWVERFRGQVAADGAEATLRAWIDRLAQGVGTAAFHGAIRTAYALESGSGAEMAQALAYWAAEFEAIAVPCEGGGHLAPAEALAALAADRERSGTRYSGRGIDERMRSAAADRVFARHATSVAAAALTFDALARSLLAAYAATGSFTLLHGVTGTHAARILAPYAADPQALRMRLWHALLAAYAAEGCPPIAGWRLAGEDHLAWPDIHAWAVRCDDEHQVKLAYTCWREWEHRGDDLYRRVASATVCHAARRRHAAHPALAIPC